MGVKMSQQCFSAVRFPELRREMVALASLSSTSLPNNADKGSSQPWEH